jgi:hypothetical protein
MFAVSAAMLLLEVALTRIFSFVMWYHLTYLVISLALLGYGAAGTFLATDARVAGGDYRATLRRVCSLLSVVTVLAVFVGAAFPTDPEALFEGHYSEMLVIALTHLTLAIPFFLAGTAIGFVLMRNRTETNRLYAADLSGAGLGSLFAVVIIDRLGAVSAVFVAAALPAGVALLAAWKERNAKDDAVALLATGALAAFLAAVGLDHFHASRPLVVAIPAVLFVGCAVASRRTRGSASTAALAHGAIIALAASAAIVSGWWDAIPLRTSGGKEMTARDQDVVFHKWNIVARIDVTPHNVGKANFGGFLSTRYDGPTPEVMAIFQDATAPTGMLHLKGDVADSPLLDAYLQGAVYKVHPQPKSALVIGVGGGIDVFIAEHARTEHIVGVDINPVTIGLLEHRYRDWMSSLFEGHDLRLVVSEGRHFVTSTDEKFDVIQMSGVDTYSALSTGAMVLSENYLYTTQAIRDFLARLAPGGILSYSRWLFTPPRETLKLVVTASSELRALGVTDPSKHFAIVEGGPVAGRWADTLIRKEPFTDADLDGLRAWAASQGFDLLYDPYRAQKSAFDEYLHDAPAAQQKFVADYTYDVDASTDDRPFFFQFYRWSSLFHPRAVEGEGGYQPTTAPRGLVSMLLTLVEVTILSILFVLLPLRRKGPLELPRAHLTSWMISFAGLGLGFIAIEMVLMQKLSVFVGGPAYSMSVTLFALLVFSGLGSRISSRLAHASFRRVGGMIGVLLVAQALELAFLDYAVPSMLSLGHAARIAVAIVGIAPLGVMMGMPFPTLLAKAGATAERVVPWAWGINACATVVGSVLSVIASIQLGFNVTWAIAMGAYALVGIMVLGWRAPEPAPS